MRNWMVGVAIGLLLSGSAAQQLRVIDFPNNVGGHSAFPRLSKNGQVLATNFTFAQSDYPRPALWRAQTGWQFLRADGSLTSNWREAVVGYIKDISYDGTVVTYIWRSGSSEFIFRWRMGVGVQALPRSGHMVAYLSWDGAYVVGAYGGYYVRWDAQGRMERLFEERRYYTVMGFSGDGRVVVGNYERFDPPAAVYAFRWVEGRGVERLPLGGADVVSYDGRVVAGPGGCCVARWVEGWGTEWVIRGVESARAKDISGDGSVIVGWYRRDRLADYSAFLWQEGRGWVDLNEAYAALLPEEWRLSEAWGVSADGRYVAGGGSRPVPEGYRMGFYYLLDRRVMGDVDGNGCVDDGDLLRVLFAFGQVGSGLPEDVDEDGVVGESDLLAVLRHFGVGC